MPFSVEEILVKKNNPVYYLKHIDYFWIPANAPTRLMKSLSASKSGQTGLIILFQHTHNFFFINYKQQSNDLSKYSSNVIKTLSYSRIYTALSSSEYRKHNVPVNDTAKRSTNRNYSITAGTRLTWRLRMQTNATLPKMVAILHIFRPFSVKASLEDIFLP